MKIIKYGLNLRSTSKQRLHICPVCGCAFEIENEERETFVINDYQRVNCPNSTCNFTIKLRYAKKKIVKDLFECTPENIYELEKNEIFVFGSNLRGDHIGGAARIALERFGAIQGQGIGLQGNSYAIPTLNVDMKPLSIHDLTNHIINFLAFADSYPTLKFYVTKIGCGIAGFTVDQIKSIFMPLCIPSNVVLPKEFCYEN